MNRLKAVLTPAVPAGPRSRRIAVGLAAVIAGVAGAGSLAVAAQRQPVVAPAPVDVVADQPVSAPAPAPRRSAVAAPAPSGRPAPLPAPAVEAQPAAVETPVATAQEPPPADISRVTWAQHPIPMYPALAAADGIDGGTVILSCTVESDGRASGCTVLSETPEGVGFGDAALASMERARFSPRTVDGAAPNAKVRFTIRFRLAE